MKPTKAGLRRLLPDRIDIHMYAGALLVSIGTGMYSRPAGLIVLGVALLVFVYWRPE